MRISDWSSDVCSSDLGELFDVLVQFGQREGDFTPRFQLLQPESLEITDQHELGQIVIAQAKHVIVRLPLGLEQIFARALLLDQQHARPEQVDESALVALDQIDLLLEHPDALPYAPDDVETRGYDAHGSPLSLRPLLVTLRELQG